MANSTYVNEEGTSIVIGDHGAHDFVFDEGTPVTDTGNSQFVFEEGTGLGGRQDAVLFIRNGSGSFSEYQTDLASATGNTVTEIGMTTFEPSAYNLLVITVCEGATEPSEDHLSDVGDLGGSSDVPVAIHAEDNADVDRGVYAQQYVDAIGTGTVSFDPNSALILGGVDSCEANIPSGSDHPIFSGVSTLSRRKNELDVASGRVGSDPDWNFASGSDVGRIWLDGSYFHVIDNNYNSCDNETYTDNCAKWLNGDI